VNFFDDSVKSLSSSARREAPIELDETFFGQAGEELPGEEGLRARVCPARRRQHSSGVADKVSNGKWLMRRTESGPRMILIYSCAGSARSQLRSGMCRVDLIVAIRADHQQCRCREEEAMSMSVSVAGSSIAGHRTKMTRVFRPPRNRRRTAGTRSEPAVGVEGRGAATVAAGGSVERGRE